MDLTYLQNILAELSLLDHTQHRELERLKTKTIEAFNQLFPTDTYLIGQIRDLRFNRSERIYSPQFEEMDVNSIKKLKAVIESKIEVLKELPVSKALVDLKQDNNYKDAMIKQHERTMEQYKIELQKADDRLIAARRTNAEQETKIKTLEDKVKQHGFITKLKNNLSIGAILALIGGIFTTGFYVGNTKYDRDKIELSDYNRSLKDSLVGYQKGIEYMRQNSDSAHQILGHMPYNEMNLDTMEFRKVQTQIEEAGKVLHLNTTYRR